MFSLFFGSNENFKICFRDLSDQTKFYYHLINSFTGKGELISKVNCQAKDSSKKRTKKFVFTSKRRVFVCFMEESSTRKKRFEIIWPLVRVEIDSITAKPYILPKSLLQWICSKLFGLCMGMIVFDLQGYGGYYRPKTL
jgi:hypothetical protein